MRNLILIMNSYVESRNNKHHRHHLVATTEHRLNLNSTTDDNDISTSLRQCPSGGMTTRRLTTTLSTSTTPYGIETDDVAMSDCCLYRPTYPEDSVPSWTLPSIFRNTHGSSNNSNNNKKLSSSSGGLNDIPLEQLRVYIEPILIGLQSLDAEELLQLERVTTTTSGCAILRDG